LDEDVGMLEVGSASSGTLTMCRSFQKHHGVRVIPVINIKAKIGL
jgi:hypothetical protein